MRTSENWWRGDLWISEGHRSIRTIRVKLLVKSGRRARTRTHDPCTGLTSVHPSPSRTSHAREYRANRRTKTDRTSDGNNYAIRLWTTSRRAVPVRIRLQPLFVVSLRLAEETAESATIWVPKSSDQRAYKQIRILKQVLDILVN